MEVSGRKGVETYNKMNFSLIFIFIGVVLVSLLLTLNIFTPSSSVSTVDFEQVIAGWDIDILHLETVFRFNFIKSKFIRCFPVLPLLPCYGPSLVFQLFPCYYFHPFKVSKIIRSNFTSSQLEVPSDSENTSFTSFWFGLASFNL